MPRTRRSIPVSFKRATARRQGLSQRVQSQKASPARPSYANPRRKGKS